MENSLVRKAQVFHFVWFLGAVILFIVDTFFVGGSGGLVGLIAFGFMILFSELWHICRIIVEAIESNEDKSGS